MEEKLKSPDSQSGDSEVRLFQRCQELQALVQEKEDVIGQLEQQLEEQVKHTKHFIKATDLVPVDVFCFFISRCKRMWRKMWQAIGFTHTQKQVPTHTLCSTREKHSRWLCILDQTCLLSPETDPTSGRQNGGGESS